MGLILDCERAHALGAAIAQGWGDGVAGIAFLFPIYVEQAQAGCTFRYSPGSTTGP